mmetsp:Transcript_57715/g.102411  ORF Transcript_57715/g.102411 Transcript_57715/m.102411 type:complete len:492 (-) Transcript_57715:80-1555(-)
MQEPVDRAAMIEAASRSLRQQMNRGGVRDRPRSKGSLHDGNGTAPSQSPVNQGAESWPAQGFPVDEPRSAENAQRRIRSAENQHRSVTSASRDGPQLSVQPTASTSALDNYSLEDEVEEDAGQAGPIDDVPKNIFPSDFHQELKRPLSRKKDPSASAAAGLGAFAGPARMTDAFEQRKTRQPIPVESWGPRPPSRAGLPQKGSNNLDTGLSDPLDPTKLIGTPSRASGSASVGRPSSKVGNETPGGSRPSSKIGGEQALGSKVVGGTWASARAEPRVHSETRRGRERKPPNRDRASPEVGYAADLGVFGCGTRAPNQQLTKSLSGVFDHHSSQFRGAPATAPSRAAHSTWADAPSGDLEVSGCGLRDATAPSPWPGSPSQSHAGSPPTRKGARHSFGADAVASQIAVEDVEADPDPHGLHSNFRRGGDMPPQVIVTRSNQTQSRGQVRRSERTDQVRRSERTEQRRVSERGERNMPFSTSLDNDFLSLFAS